MKTLQLLLCVLGLSLAVGACKTSENIKAADLAGHNYPLNIHFEPDYALPKPIQGIITASRGGFSQVATGRTRMNTRGDGFFLNVRGSAVTADLPFYAERELFANVGSRPAIVWNDRTMRNFKYGRTADNKVTAIEFEMKQLAETFHVQLVILPNEKAYLTINSPLRGEIRFEGSVAAL